MFTRMKSCRGRGSETQLQVGEKIIYLIEGVKG